MPSGEHLKKQPSEGDPAPNSQLYSNGKLQAMFDLLKDNETPGAISPDALFNQKVPNLQILHEKPEHRYLLWMKAQGASNREIAANSGYSESWLSQLFRQPWAQERLVTMLKESGQDVLEQTLTLIKGEVVNSVFTLVEIRDDPEAPKAVRRACSVDLIEQYLGKPKQKVDVSTTTSSEQNVEKIDDEIKRLELEENRLLGKLN